MKHRLNYYNIFTSIIVLILSSIIIIKLSDIIRTYHNESGLNNFSLFLAKKPVLVEAILKL
ncbi:MAG: hypothetical protein ABRQ39_28730, partial [Candidatus Eremiobacterota bacterium]